MGRKKVKLGIKWLDGKFYEIAFIDESTTGVVWGAVNDGKHVTLLKETDSLSSHMTIQDTKYHKPIARLSKKSIPTKDEIAKAIFNPRLIRDDELDEEVIYITPKFLDAIKSISMIYVEKIEGKEFHSYLDLPSMIEQVRNIVIVIQKEPSAYFGSCQIRDFLQKEDLTGIRRNKQVIITMDHKLWELTMPLMGPLGFEDKTLNNLVDFIGYSYVSESIKTNIEKIKNG